jgi:RimJ/RimL family protein N-acetyltransferase
MAWPQPITLRGTHAVLEPLHPSRTDELIDAVRDGDLWKLWYTSVPAPERMASNIAFRLELQASGQWLPFCVVDVHTSWAVGMTSYMNIDAANRRLEIGSTWYRQSVQRTAINTECKLMLLRHAFEELGCIAVEFRTHFFNHRSRRAIERVGAKLDGILRSHQRLADGSLRDTCVYSIIASEWPAVRMHLESRLTTERT